MGPDGDGNCPHQGHRMCRGDGRTRMLCYGCYKDKASQLDRPCQGWQVGGCPRHKQARLGGTLCSGCNNVKINRACGALRPEVESTALTIYLIR